ncbi:hypothetical protein GDO81_019829, partial [Engystomops pustulosus]
MMDRHRKDIPVEKLNGSSGFTLLGFSDFHCNHQALFAVFLVVYLLTWTGNLLLLSSIKLSPHLHTPMYFFLGNLSFIDICFSTVTVPKLLMNLLQGGAEITFLECFVQMYAFYSLGNVENLLLSVMAFDRYLAVCNPLRYSSMMNRKIQITLVVASWVVSCLHSLLHSYTVSQLTYCENRLIPHYFCDITSLLQLSCSSTTVAEILIFSEGSIEVVTPFLFILYSYLLIAKAIKRLKTAKGRSKAFSSCSSHLIVICLFYGSVIFIYLRPPANYSADYNRLVSVLYTVVTPTINPFIYSLRNQEVRNTLQKFIKK